MSSYSKEKKTIPTESVFQKLTFDYPALTGVFFKHVA